MKCWRDGNSLLSNTKEAGRRPENFYDPTCFELFRISLRRRYRAGRYWRLVSSQLSSLGGSMLYERENQIVVLNKTKLRPTVCGRDCAYEKDKFLKQDQLLAHWQIVAHSLIAIFHYQHLQLLGLG